MKVYIAGKMTGLEDRNEKKFLEAEKELEKNGYTVMSPFHLHLGPPKNTWEDYLKCSLIMMLECDKVCVLDDWQDSPGAKLEVEVAKRVKMKVFSIVDGKEI
ncbi:MAG: DUF4406 domain-containing protein [Promethearchaeota archaeon]